MSTENIPDAIALTMSEAAAASRFSRAFLYKEAAAGRLVLTHRGRRTVVLRDDLFAWLNAGRRTLD